MPYAVPHPIRLCRRPTAGHDAPAYRSTALHHPACPLAAIPQTLSETTGPVHGHGPVGPLDGDFTRQHPGEPLGERIVVAGRVPDEDARPVPDALVEIWQANAVPLPDARPAIRGPVSCSLTSAT